MTATRTKEAKHDRFERKHHPASVPYTIELSTTLTDMLDEIERAAFHRRFDREPHTRQH